MCIKIFGRNGCPSLISLGYVVYTTRVYASLYLLTGHGPSGIAPLPGSIALLMALIANEPPPVAPEPFDPLRFM